MNYSIENSYFAIPKPRHIPPADANFELSGYPFKVLIKGLGDSAQYTNSRRILNIEIDKSIGLSQDLVAKTLPFGLLVLASPEKESIKLLNLEPKSSKDKHSCQQLLLVSREADYGQIVTSQFFEMRAGDTVIALQRGDNTFNVNSLKGSRISLQYLNKEQGFLIYDPISAVAFNIDFSTDGKSANKTEEDSLLSTSCNIQKLILAYSKSESIEETEQVFNKNRIHRLELDPLQIAEGQDDRKITQIGEWAVTSRRRETELSVNQKQYCDLMEKSLKTVKTAMLDPGNSFLDLLDITRQERFAIQEQIYRDKEWLELHNKAFAMIQEFFDDKIKGLEFESTQKFSDDKIEELISLRHGYENLAKRLSELPQIAYIPILQNHMNVLAGDLLKVEEIKRNLGTNDSNLENILEELKKIREFIHPLDIQLEALSEKELGNIATAEVKEKCSQPISIFDLGILARAVYYEQITSFSLYRDRFVGRALTLGGEFCEVLSRPSIDETVVDATQTQIYAYLPKCSFDEFKGRYKLYHNRYPCDSEIDLENLYKDLVDGEHLKIPVTDLQYYEHNKERNTYTVGWINHTQDRYLPLIAGYLIELYPKYRAAKSLEESIDLLEDMHYWTAQAMFSNRGSAASELLLFEALKQIKGIPSAKWFFDPNLAAQSSSLEQFKRDYYELGGYMKMSSKST